MERSRTAFLICHGSFNPVHKHHLGMMLQARQTVEMAGFEVLRGLMAITPGRRLTQKGVEAVTDHHRLAALQQGCDSVLGPAGWLAPEPRGIHYGSGGALIQGLAPELLAEAPGATIFKVVGADVVIRYPRELQGPTVVICREGSTGELRRLINDTQLRQDNVFIVDELPGDECSSTKVRAALQRNDFNAIQQMCPDLVGAYLWKHRAHLYAHAGPGATASDKHGKGLAKGSSQDKGLDKGNNECLTKGSGYEALPSGYQAQAGRSHETTSTNRAFVLGVTGATRSGKSTLADHLYKYAGNKRCQVVGQDSFRLQGRHAAEDSWVSKDGVWVRNWETPNQTDWPAFEMSIRQAIDAFPLVIVEGYSLLYSDNVCNLLHALMWVDITEEECRKRRTNIPKGWDKSAYFAECIWPAHSRYCELVFGASGTLGRSGKSAVFGERVLLLSGSDDPGNISSQSERHLKHWQAEGEIVIAGGGQKQDLTEGNAGDGRSKQRPMMNESSEDVAVPRRWKRGS